MSKFTLEEVNKKMGFDGTLTNETYNIYKWEITSDSSIEVTFYSSGKSTIKADFNKEEVASEETIGKVVGQSLLAQQKYDPHTQDKEITLQVSKGIEISVPNVYGQSITEAKALLESSEYGFKVKLEVLTPPTTASEIETMKLNVVMTQSIKAFTKMTKKLGTEITLGYYDTRPEIPVDEPDDTDVPEEPAIDNPETE